MGSSGARLGQAGAVPARFTDLNRPPLDEAAARRALVRPGSAWTEIQVVGETASTNADVVAAARAGAAAGLVRVAEHQHGGRGRLGRSWQAPPRSGLTLSVLVRPDVAAQHWPWLPLLTGVAVAEACRRAAEVDAVLKWPNDVMIADRKVAGVLAERVDTSAGPAAVLGVGLNVSLTQAELPVSQATSLALAGARTLDRAVLLRSVLRTLASLLEAWRGAGGEPAVGRPGLHASYTSRCSTLGRLVRVDLPDGSTVQGRAVEVDAGGRLVVESSTSARPGAAPRRLALGAGDVVHVYPSTPTDAR